MPIPPPITLDELQDALLDAEGKAPITDGYYTAVEYAEIWGLGHRQANRKIARAIEAGLVKKSVKHIKNASGTIFPRTAYKIFPKPIED